eukprot:7384702-Prymnesium_polylepis.1
MAAARASTLPTGTRRAKISRGSLRPTNTAQSRSATTACPPATASRRCLRATTATKETFRAVRAASWNVATCSGLSTTSGASMARAAGKSRRPSSDRFARRPRT